MSKRFLVAETICALSVALLLAGCASEQTSDPARTWADGPPPPAEVERVTTAAMYGQTDRLYALLKAGQPPGAAYDENGVTALMLAARMGHADVADTLLAAGANPSATADDGTTALLESVARGHVAIVERLLSAGANPDRPTKDVGTPLLMATVQGHAEVVDALLKAGADPTVGNPHGYTPLESAQEQGHAQIAARLREAGAAKK
jgi:cytohesin